MTLQLLGGASIVQAPVAVTVSKAGALGLASCAMLGFGAQRQELKSIKAQTGKPFNGHFCHAKPVPDLERKGASCATLSP